MSGTVAAGAVLIAWVLAGASVASGQPLKPRDLYLEKLPPDSASGSGGHHLGVSYTVKLVDLASATAHEVDPDGSFHEGDCFAVEFTSNRDGGLYIFNHGSSGDWQLLMPSPKMPNEVKTVKAGIPLTVPVEYCFQLDKTEGVETLVLVITERKEDVDQLAENLRPAAHPHGPLVSVAGPDPNQSRMKATRDVVESWREMGSRDMVIQKVSKPEVAGEHPYSVYVVKSVLSDTDRLVIEIKIRHE